MNLAVQSKSEKPIYEQLCDQIISQILSGQIEADFCLPSIRAVAKELEISVITVKNAYEKLENAGYIYSVQGKGSFVSNLKFSREKMRLTVAEEKIKNDAEYYRGLGLTLEEISELFKKYL